MTPATKLIIFKLPKEAAKYLQSAEEHGTKTGNLESKIQEYLSRAQELGQFHISHFLLSKLL